MSEANEKTRPNILFFFTDDQRFDTIRALGHEQVYTPNMDTLVREGTTFTHAHIMGGTSGAVCMPSRAMLMTGRTLFHLYRQGQSIPQKHVMLGELLRTEGYETFGTGKWHNGSDAYARSFTDGAEIFFGGMEDHWNVPACDFDPNGEYDVYNPAVRNPFYSNETVQRQCDHITPGKHSSELFCDAGIDFLRRHEGETPFFMYLSFMAPHDPRTMPRKYLEMYDPEEIELPENFEPRHPFDNGELCVRDELLAPSPRSPEEIRRHIAEYYAMISHLDAEVGRVLEALEETGHAEETIIIFAGDNGLALGQHGLMGKQNLYDHSLRVPLIMSGPGIPRDKCSDAHCYLLDIYPTLCELLDVAVPDSVEGQSLVPAMCEESRLRETMFFAYKEYQRCVRDERYKLIEYVVEGERTTQLFDIHEDPWELHNLAQDPAHSEHLKRLRQALFQWRDALDDEEDSMGERFWKGYRE
ncbi:MAG: sulfatase-like hydrolase/transferase [Anaerolineales bacterium]